MSEVDEDWLSGFAKSEEQSLKMVERLFAAAQPGAVFGEPVKSGDFTVITASEVGAGGGFGFGRGIGPTPEQPSATPRAVHAPAQTGGGGSGGGGGSMGRPVAIIVIGPNGADVKPVLDMTKLGIAGITTGVAMLALLRKLIK